MKISDLREFLKLSQSLNFSQTAKELYISQPVLSKHISNLERDLGVKLFIRDQHQVRLTRVGEIFAHEADEVVRRYDRAIETVNHVKAGADSAMTIGFLSGAVMGPLSQALVELDEKHPNTPMRFLSYEADEIFSKLEDGTCDAIVGTSMFFGNLDTPSYGWQPLYADELCIAMPADHPLASREIVRAEDLKGCTLLDSAPMGADDPKASVLELLSPEKNDITINRGITGIEGFRVLLCSGKYMSLITSHTKSVLGDKVAMVPLAEAAGMGAYVGVAWRRDVESDLLLEFVGMLKRAAGVE